MAENVTELRPYMSTVQMIREFADRVERGEVGSDHIVAIALDGKDGAVEVFGWGPRAGNPLEAVGMTTAAQHIILGGG